MSETALRHVEHLAVTIGPRGSTTEQETKAHDYCQATLEGLGYEVHRDSFYSPTSGWHPYALAEGLMVLSVAIFWLLGRGADAQAGGLAAAALGLITTVSFLLQVSHRPNPLKSFVPAARSQNVWAVSPASDVARQQVVFTGHVDTSPAALAMQSPALWQGVPGAHPARRPGPHCPGGHLYLGHFHARPAAAHRRPGAGNRAAHRPGVHGRSPASPSRCPAPTTMPPARRPCWPLPSGLRPTRWPNTTVFLVNTGCEEVGCAGLIDWIQRHSGLAANAQLPGARQHRRQRLAGELRA